VQTLCIASTAAMLLGNPSAVSCNLVKHSPILITFLEKLLKYRIKTTHSFPPRPISSLSGKIKSANLTHFLVNQQLILSAKYHQ